MSGVAQRVEEAKAARSARPIHMFDIPAGMGLEVGSIGLVQLTASEELMATKRARGDGIRLAFELAKSSLVEVDERVLNRTDGEADSIWDTMSPKLRQLVLTAYAELHTPQEDMAEVFLKSRRVRV